MVQYITQLEKWLLEQASQSEIVVANSFEQHSNHMHFVWIVSLLVLVMVTSLLLCALSIRMLRYLGSFFYSYPNALFTFDANGELVNYNQTFKELTHQFMFDPIESKSVCEFFGNDWHSIQWQFKDFVEKADGSYWNIALLFPSLAKTKSNPKPFFQFPLTIKSKQNEIIHYRIEFVCIKAWRKTKAVCRLIDNSEVMHLKQSTELDPFTRLLNKPNMIFRLRQEVDRAKRQRIPLSLLFIDIDEFKKINDIKGHAYGDKVLKWVAKTIKQRVRDTDVIGRFGGDEFIMVCPDCSESQANAIAITVQKLLDNHEFSVSVSIGIAEMRPNDDVDTFMERADQALYHSKRNGKNRVSIASELTL